MHPVFIPPTRIASRFVCVFSPRPTHASRVVHDECTRRQLVSWSKQTPLHNQTILSMPTMTEDWKLETTHKPHASPPRAGCCAHLAMTWVMHVCASTQCPVAFQPLFDKQ